MFSINRSVSANLEKLIKLNVKKEGGAVKKLENSVF